MDNTKAPLTSQPSQNAASRAPSQCRGCGDTLDHVFVDLGFSPLANSYLKAAELNVAEKFYPLKVFVCESCLLVQLEEFESPDHIFSDYLYFSSFSASWVEHAR
ncbi:MAG: class I SAM-dependent methyltransferase, partial [Porticoccaceae bacterium]